MKLKRRLVESQAQQEKSLVREVQAKHPLLQESNPKVPRELLNDYDTIMINSLSIQLIT